MDRPAATSRILRSKVFLERIAKLARAAGLPEGAPIPLDLIVEAIETAGAAAAFDDVVDEWTLCDVLHCTRPTLQRYLELGLPVIRLGIRKWYSLSSTEAWLRSRERAAEPRRPGRPRSVRPETEKKPGSPTKNRRPLQAAPSFP